MINPLEGSISPLATRPFKSSLQDSPSQQIRDPKLESSPSLSIKHASKLRHVNRSMAPSDTISKLQKRSPSVDGHAGEEAKRLRHQYSSTAQQLLQSTDRLVKDKKYGAMPTKDIFLHKKLRNQ